MLINLILFITTATARAEGPPTAIVPSARIAATVDCDDRLARTVGTLERALIFRKARWGKVAFGHFDELEAQLIRAGVGRARADRYARALARVVAATSPSPGLLYILEFVAELAAHHAFVGVPSAESSLAIGDPALFFDQRYPEAILLLPHPVTESPEEFAVDVLQPIIRHARNRLFTAWLNSIRYAEPHGPLYNYATWPEFRLIYDTLFEIYFDAELAAICAPAADPERGRRLAAVLYHDLSAEGSVTRALLKRFKISPASMDRIARQVVNQMIGTVAPPTRPN